MEPAQQLLCEPTQALSNIPGFIDSGAIVLKGLVVIMAFVFAIQIILGTIQFILSKLESLLKKKRKKGTKKSGPLGSPEESGLIEKELEKLKSKDQETK